MHIILLFLSIGIAIVAQMLFKGFSSVPRPENQALYLYFLDTKLIFGMGLYFVSALLYIVSLQKINLSVAYPTVAISYVFILGLSHVFFGESLTVYKILGCGFILVGIALMWKP
jgi:multidrug transporter EmrE-like cation transporter